MSKEVSTNFIRSQIYKTSQKQIKEIDPHKDNTQPPSGGPKRPAATPGRVMAATQALTRAKNVPSASAGGVAAKECRNAAGGRAHDVEEDVVSLTSGSDGAERR